MQRTDASRARASRSRLSLAGFAVAVASLAGLSCNDGFPTAPTEVARVIISPRAPTLIVGDSVRLSAVAVDVNHTGIDGKRPRWASASNATATVDSLGVVRAVHEGTVVITAEIDGHTDTTLVTVLPTPVDSVAVRPPVDTMLLGQTRALVAVTYAANDSVLTGRVVTWQSDDAGVVQVQAATGIATAMALGSTTVHATSEGKTGSGTIVVIPVPVRQVVVSPNPAAVQQGFTIDLDATTLDSIGGVLPGRAVTWQSLNTGIATVNATTGVVTGVSAGSTTIRATSEGIVTDVPLTVSVPVIALGATTASFQARWQTANPAAQTIGVTNAGPWTLSGLSASVSYGSGSGWLSATLNTTTAPATLTLQPVTGSLAPGTYTATVTVASSLPGVASRTVNVTFTVLPRAIIAFSNDAPQFASQANGLVPPAQAVTITNAGTGTLDGLTRTLTFGPGASGWMTATLNATTAPATLTLTPTTTALAVGTYTAEVVVSSTNAATNGSVPDTVRVTYVVAQGPIIGLSRTTVTPTAQAFAVVGATETVSITNAGQGTLSGLSASVTYNSPQTGWLTATVSPTTAPATLTLVASAASLPAGTYSATVTVSSTVVGVQSQTVAVSFTVTPQPVIALAPTSRAFTATRGGTLPGSQDIAVSNTGGGTLSGLAITTEYLSGSGWLASSLNTTTAPATLTVQPNTTTLAPGTYDARVIVTSSVPGVAPDTATVSYTVQQPQIGLGTATIAYGSRTRGFADDSTVAITNIGEGTLSGLSVTDNASWITTTLNSTAAPTSVLISTNTTNLTAGTYTGTVTVSSSLPGVTSKTVTVTVTVQQPIISLAASAVIRTIRPGQTATGSSIGVSNSGSGTLSGLSVTDNASWITASLGSTTAPTTLTLTFSTSGLGVGTYTGRVIVSSAVPGVAPDTVNVTLYVRWSFANDIAPMLASCNGCHTNTDNSISDFTVHSQLVNAIAATSTNCDGRTRVIANNASGSLVYQKLANTHNCGVRMPQGGPYWTSADLQKLAEWINDGAPNN